MIDKVQQGKRNRRAGGEFERKVRNVLIDQGWMERRSAWFGWWNENVRR